MKIASRAYGDIMILDLKGNLTTGEGDIKLREALRKEVSEGHKKLIINLAGVGFIDSGGLGELMAGYTHCKKENAQLVLLNLTKKIHDLLQITQLITMFDAFDDEKEAIASFA